MSRLGRDGRRSGGARNRSRILPDHFNLQGDLLLVETGDAGARALHAARRCAANCAAAGISDLVPIAGREETRHVQFDERGAFCLLQRPARIATPSPIAQDGRRHQPGNEIRLRGPDHAVLPGSMIAQALQQHVIETRRANHLAHGKAGKAVEQISRLAALGAQEGCVIGKTRDEIIDVVAERDVMAVHVREIGNGIVCSRQTRGPHSIRVDVLPGVLRL